MLVCGTSFPPDVEYFLDGAVENWELDGLSHNALHLLADRQTVTSMVDSAGEQRRALAARRDICYRLNEYACGIVASLDEGQQRAFVATALILERQQIFDLVGVLASWNYEDQTIGGALQSWKRVRDMRVRVDGTPTPRVLGRLQSNAAIRRYVRRDDGDAVRHHAHLTARIKDLPWPDHPREAKVLEPLFAEQAVARQRRVDEARDKFIAQIEAERRGLVGRDRRTVKAARKRLIRAATMSEQVLGRDATNAFIRGEPVPIAAKNEGLVFEVRTENVGAMGHGGVRVSLKADTGERLAGLCLYFDKTPALDELVAIALHTGAGNAGELIKTGNLYGVTEAGSLHPALSGRHRTAAQVTEPEGQERTRWTRWTFGYDRQRQKSLAEKYERDFGSIYRDALAVAVWGRKATAVRRFWNLMGETPEALAA